MKKLLITGANGFVGKNLISILRTIDDYQISTFDTDNTYEDLDRYCQDCDFVVHLAGVNRPKSTDEFYSGNADLTSRLCELLQSHNNKSPVILSSSIQALNDNDYGKSKKLAEDVVLDHGKKNGSKAYVFRFKNLYGKWARPNYNSVVATWCYNIANNLDINVDNIDAEIEFCYIDDVVKAIIAKMGGKSKSGYYEVEPTDKVALGYLRDLILSFRESRTNKFYPNVQSRFSKNLYATYLSYLNEKDFSYLLAQKNDERGSFTEFLKSSNLGQISVNVSKPGIKKGQHWHSTKNEKFLVVSGSGIIRFRDIFSDKVIEYSVSSDKLEVVDIPTGYTHNIENMGSGDMVTIMWASDSFDPENPDTYFKEV